jgi:hypothetical protein
MNFSIYIICPTILLLLLLAMIQISNNNGVKGKITNSENVVRFKNVSSEKIVKASHTFISTLRIISRLE